jgi:hypothetical protein
VDSKEEPRVKSNSLKCRPLDKRKPSENLINETQTYILINQINDYLKIDSLIFVLINKIFYS